MANAERQLFLVVLRAYRSRLQRHYLRQAGPDAHAVLLDSLPSIAKRLADGWINPRFLRQMLPVIKPLSEVVVLAAAVNNLRLGYPGWLMYETLCVDALPVGWKGAFPRGSLVVYWPHATNPKFWRLYEEPMRGL